MAISHRRLVKLENGQVTFGYRQRDSRRWQSSTLPAEEFIRRFLQHVLPKGFQKVRYYGLFSASQRPRLAQARQLRGRPAAPEPTPPAELSPSPAAAQPEPLVLRCPTCGRPMRLSQTLRPQHCRSP